VVRRRSFRRRRRLFARWAGAFGAGMDDRARQGVRPDVPAAAARPVQASQRSLRTSSTIPATDLPATTGTGRGGWRRSTASRLTSCRWPRISGTSSTSGTIGRTRARGEARTRRIPHPMSSVPRRRSIKACWSGFASGPTATRRSCCRNPMTSSTLPARLHRTGVTEPAAPSRVIRSEKVWDWVWARRVNLLPDRVRLAVSRRIAADREMEARARAGQPAEIVVPVIDLVGAFLPSFVSLARRVSQCARTVPDRGRAGRRLDVRWRLDAGTHPRPDAPDLANARRAPGRACWLRLPAAVGGAVPRVLLRAEALDPAVPVRGLDLRGPRCRRCNAGQSCSRLPCWISQDKFWRAEPKILLATITRSGSQRDTIDQRCNGGSEDHEDQGANRDGRVQCFST